MREWGYEEKLAESGFEDLEGSIDGPFFAKGPSSISLDSLANRSKDDHGIKDGSVFRDFAEVADADDPALSFPSALKARYYHFAELIVCQALREGSLDHDTCFTWALHAQAQGERTISKLLNIPRSRVRKYLKVFRKNIIERLDMEASEC
jgi:hypothetical protein